MDSWTFLTNHGHVLLCIAADPQIRLRDVADRVGITERATQRIVADLLAAGYLSSQKTGRRRSYQVQSSLPFRHPVERHNEIGVLLRLVAAPLPRGRRSALAAARVPKSKRAARGSAA
jgi:DNA-binding MarR family transcriptional regulator